MRIEEPREPLKLLGTLANAVHENSVNEMFGNICFDGENAFAYDGVTAIVVPFETDFAGAVNGKLLLSLLNGMGDIPIDFTASASSLRIQAKGLNARLAMASAEKFIFAVPNDPVPAQRIQLSEEFFNLMKKVKISLPKGETVRDELDGMTFYTEADDLSVYACDATTISKLSIRTKISGAANSVFMLPRTACTILDAIANLCPGEDEVLAVLKYDTDRALIRFESGVDIYTPLKKTPPPDYTGKEMGLFSIMDINTKTKLPEGFAKELRKFMALDIATVNIKAENNNYQLKGKSAKGSLTIDFEVEDGQIGTEVIANIQHLARGCGPSAEICIAPDFVYFCDGNFQHFLAGSSE